MRQGAQEGQNQWGWKLCPVVREANGRLRDRVRVDGRTEVHGEGGLLSRMARGRPPSLRGPREQTAQVHLAQGVGCDVGP